MEAREYSKLYELEQELWWFRGMRRISFTILDRFWTSSGDDSPTEARILDAGCGTGGNLLYMKDLGNVVGLDRSPLALQYAQKRRSGALIAGDIGDLPFRNDSFDLVTSFDVLYHLGVRNDEKALAEVARVTRPGGTVLVRVPAIDKLRSRHDEAVHTRQRYGRRELRMKLDRAGLRPVFLTYANSFLFPAAAIRRVAERALRPGHAGSEVERTAPALNEMLLAVLTLESFLFRFTSLPIGLSLLAVARKVRILEAE